jgi:hypothetical protein
MMGVIQIASFKEKKIDTIFLLKSKIIDVVEIV